MGYDKNNVFAKIIRKELPCEFVDENENAFAFNDISPKAPVHILIIPKKEYINFSDFITNALEKEIIDFYALINKIIIKLDLTNKGYRLITNSGEDGRQAFRPRSTPSRPFLDWFVARARLTSHISDSHGPCFSWSPAWVS